MAQRSNRAELIEGTLRCLERLPPERVTARVIATEAAANLASITYHFGSKDALVTEAVVEGLDRWLASVAAALGDLAPQPPETRFRRATEVVESSCREHTGLAQNFIAALARAQHDPAVRTRLAAGFHRTRPVLAAILGLRDDQAGHDAAGLVLAQFNGWLLQLLLDPALGIAGDRMQRAQARLRTILPSE